MSLSPDEKRLEVVGAQVPDAGVFTCQATNPAGVVKQDFHLEVHSTVLVLDLVSGLKCLHSTVFVQAYI